MPGDRANKKNGFGIVGKSLYGIQRMKSMEKNAKTAESTD
jgi:hypothetical protein